MATEGITPHAPNAPAVNYPNKEVELQKGRCGGGGAEVVFMSLIRA